MASKPELDNLPSPTNDQSDGELDSKCQGDDESLNPANNNVANILKKLQSTGALIKPKKEYRCFTCDEDFRDWEDLENHLLEHVSLPSVVLDKLPSDEEDSPPVSGDENWTDEEVAAEAEQSAKTAPTKIDISQLLKNKGISLKSSNEIKSGGMENKHSDSALSKLSGLGFTIKKNVTPIKKEPEPEKQKESNNDVLKRLGNLGGIKLKLKSDGNNTNSFKVVNGLKDFKASSDDEDDANSKDDADEDDEQDEKSGDLENTTGDQNDSEDESSQNRQNSESEDSDKSPTNTNINNISLINLQNKKIKTEPNKTIDAASPLKEILATKPMGRPAVKQTPKRGANLPITKETQSANMPTTVNRRTSNDTSSTVENVVVKQEMDSGETPAVSNIPLFSGQIKPERASPPLSQTEHEPEPIIARVKTEPETTESSSARSTITTHAPPTPLLPVTKVEDTSMTIIEINGDSNDEDDDCCVVSATPAPDIKPIIPKTEIIPPAYTAPSYTTPSSQSSYSSSNVMSSRMPTLSTAKQHNFDWNAPDTKPPIDMLEKSADDIFESLLSSGTKKENLLLSDASEYISLDTLGPQQTCDVCNTRFTDKSLLEEHRRMTGHSNCLVAPTSSTLLPYNPSNNILSSLLPVKQLAEQVGKLQTIGNGAGGFTHQQNVMINIQAYPGAGGVMGPPQPYNAYPTSGQNMHPGYQQASNNMFGNAQQTMPGQYPGQHYMGQQGYGQFQTPMSKPSFPGAQNSFSSTGPYSSSPLQNMQQAYGQNSSNMLNTQSQMAQMGPPGPSPGQYVPSSSPGGTMKPPNSGVRIQNVQTFSPSQMSLPGQTVAPAPEISGQVPGQLGGNQMPAPSQIRMAAGANVTRPRMATIRGQRPTIRPGLQVQGQVRGQKPGQRMPIKRPGGMTGGPGQKRRPDMLLPGKHDNEDCQVMSMQKQRDGLPLIQSVQGARDKLNLGSQISITKKTVNKEANAVANVLASRGISIKQKQKSRSPTPDRPIPHIPNLGAGMSIKHTSKSSNFSIPEAKIGGGMLQCTICKKMCMNQNLLHVHMSAAHPQSKIPMFKCDECPASYPKSLQLQHHKRVFHNVTGGNRELGLPVVDLSHEENLKRLSNLGIFNFIPLANREQANGCFGIPVISVHNMQSGMISGLQALGADGLLSLGPLKPLPNT